MRWDPPKTFNEIYGVARKQGLAPAFWNTPVHRARGSANPDVWRIILLLEARFEERTEAKQ